MVLLRISRIHIFILAAAALAPALGAQDSGDSPNQPSQQKSLAEIAKESKKVPPKHAKKRFTDDDLDAERLFPKLNLDGDDNSDDIITAIGDYKSKHTPEETEQAVHDWYSQYDSVLAASVQQNTHTQQERSSTNYHDYWNCQDYPNYENCILRRRQDMLDQHDAQVRIGANFAAIGRIQQDFMKIRMGILSYNLRYSWFKVRNANGVSSY